MELIINASSSAGNSYVLKSAKGEVLILEAGIPLKQVLIVNDISISSIVGCLITHEHGDHAKFMKEYADMGIDVYASQGTIDAKSLPHHNVIPIGNLRDFYVDGFRILPFDVKHDCAEPLGFLIRNPECGTVLFLTDSYYCPVRFSDLNQMIIEANYDENILGRNLNNGTVHGKVFSRVRESHMELETLKELLRANNLALLNNIVLIHLSAQNSDAIRFKQEIEDLTGKTVYVAEKGMKIPFNKTPF